MKLKVVTILALLASNACTSTDEQPVAGATEPVAAESAELSDKPVEAPAAEVKPEEAVAEAPKTEEVAAAPAAPVAAEKSGGMFVAVSHLNVRSGPGMSHAVTEVITFNVAVENLGIEKGIWVKIADGKYVAKKYLTEAKLTEPMAVQMAQPAAAAPVEAPAVIEEAPAAVEQAPAAAEQAPAAVEQAPAAAVEAAPATEEAPAPEAAPTK